MRWTFLILLGLGFILVVHVVLSFMLILSPGLEGSIAATPQKIDIFLYIMILSSASEIEQRRAIRQSWLQWADLQTRYHFFIGTKNMTSRIVSDLEQERRRFDDIHLLPDVLDDYGHLTDKILGGMNHGDRMYNGRFFLKVDTDTFVNLAELIKEMRAEDAAAHKLYWGSFPARRWRKVHKDGRFAEPDYNDCDTYPPYAVGGSYVLSWDLVAFLARNTKDLFRYANEDASVGIWLSAVHPAIRHDVRFRAGQSAKKAACEASLLTLHKQSPQRMGALYRNAEAGDMCREIGPQRE